MLLVLCVLALVSRAVGQEPCGPPLVQYVDGGAAYIRLNSQNPRYSITVKTWDAPTTGYGAYHNSGSSFNGDHGSVRLVSDTSNNLVLLVQFPSQHRQASIFEIVFNGRVVCKSVPSQGWTSTLWYSSTRRGYGIQSFPSSDNFDNSWENDIQSYHSQLDTGAFINSRIQSDGGFSLPRYPGSRPWVNTAPQHTPPQRTTTARPSAPINTKQEECGQPNNPRGLVFRGMDAQKGEWPWLAAFILKEDMTFLCGSTIISKKHVIMAAHCIFDKKKNQMDSKLFIIGVGKHNISNVYDGQFKEIKKAIIHEEYDSKTFQNDLMILVLKESLQYSTYIRPICLWPGHDELLNDVTGHEGTVVGWGRTETNPHEVSDTPMKVHVPIVSNEECRQSDIAISDDFDTDKILCAGAKNGKGPCEGDSGSALTLQISTTHARWYLRGIVSFNSKGIESICNLDNYSVFTDTAKYTSWIANAMKQT